LLPIIKAKKIYAIANINMFNVFFFLQSGKAFALFRTGAFSSGLFLYPVFSFIQPFSSSGGFLRAGEFFCKQLFF